ncbi:MAG: hypothetical protein ACREE9_20540 [Stellaceae bacterium]
MQAVDAVSSPNSTWTKKIDLDSLISWTYRFAEISEGCRLMLDGGSRAASSVFD